MAQIVKECYRFSSCDERSAYGRGEPSKVSLERGSVSDEQAKEIFGGWDSLRPYIRIVPQPR
jgi:hypothetical protein